MHILRVPYIGKVPVAFNGCSTRKNINKLITLQKKTIRAISNARYNDHTKPLFIDLHILPYEQLLHQAKSPLMHSIIHKYPTTFRIQLNNYIWDRLNNNNILGMH
jgi:hypothetical protein